MVFHLSSFPQCYSSFSFILLCLACIGLTLTQINITKTAISCFTKKCGLSRNNNKKEEDLTQLNKCYSKLNTLTEIWIKSNYYTEKII